jgi:hypothetical protein
MGWLTPLALVNSVLLTGVVAVVQSRLHFFVGARNDVGRNEAVADALSASMNPAAAAVSK